MRHFQVFKMKNAILSLSLSLFMAVLRVCVCVWIGVCRCVNLACSIVCFRSVAWRQVVAISILDTHRDIAVAQVNGLGGGRRFVGRLRLALVLGFFVFLLLLLVFLVQTAAGALAVHLPQFIAYADDAPLGMDDRFVIVIINGTTQGRRLLLTTQVDLPQRVTERCRLLMLRIGSLLWRFAAHG